MPAELIIAPEAEHDLADGYTWYEGRRTGLGKGFLKIDVNSSISSSPPPPMATDEPFDILHFPCCNETIKVERRDHHFCVICGTEVDMGISDLKKVFLSHKGVDKDSVIDLKKSLKLVGYDPWLGACRRKSVATHVTT